MKNDDLITLLEKGIRSVLSNKEATSKEKMEAVNAGTRLLMIKHKISGDSDEPGGFFKQG